MYTVHEVSPVSSFPDFRVWFVIWIVIYAPLTPLCYRGLGLWLHLCICLLWNIQHCVSEEPHHVHWCVFTSWHVSLKCVCCVHSSCVGTWPTSGWGSTSLRFSSSRSRLSVCRRASPWRPHALLATIQLFWTSFFRFCKLLVYPSPVQFGLSWCLDSLEGLEGLFSFGMGDGDDGFSKCIAVSILCCLFNLFESEI